MHWTAFSLCDYYRIYYGDHWVIITIPICHSPGALLSTPPTSPPSLSLSFGDVKTKREAVQVFLARKLSKNFKILKGQCHEMNNFFEDLKN
jgi:hypothetical protein